MHWLITGGAGFIGSHLAERLLGEGHGVTVIDDFSTGSIGNIQHLKTHARFRYYVDTILNRPLLAELIDDCDAIFHLAAAVGVKLIVESPVRTIETNVKGTETVLECAAKKKRKTIIAGSSEVYGKSTKVPFAESDNLVLGPTFKNRWSYACSKAIDEFLSLAYWKEKKLPVVIVRLFNTVGRRQTGRHGMVLPTFVQQALTGDPITVYGDGTQSGCFTHVSDTVDALIRLAQNPAAVGNVFNIGALRKSSLMSWRAW
jgi:UDP-glucose 4-epimerase